MKVSKLIPLTLAVAAFFTAPLVAAECAQNGIVLNSDFETARVNGCDISGNTVVVKIKPENKPINNSPWYAFTLASDKAQQVTVRIKYYGGEHRYAPKISYNGKEWANVPFHLEKNELRFNLNLTQKPLLIAGQEIITNQDYEAWLTAIATQYQLSQVTLGESVQQRKISALVSKGNSNLYVLVIGRQHPPELTGAMAYFPFSEALLSDTKLRSQFNFVFIPNMNPDGVALGNWRHNANGVDLNRDWKAFEQPETQAVKQYLDKLVGAGGKIAYALDFHSTHHDVFYSMPKGNGLKPDTITTDWLEQLRVTEPNFTVLEKPGHNPDKGVFKQWIADTYGVHAITYEMGDNTDRALIKQVAQSAAASFSKTIQAYDSSAF